jgi:hypothetical protein
MMNMTISLMLLKDYNQCYNIASISPDSPHSSVQAGGLDAEERMRSTRRWRVESVDQREFNITPKKPPASTSGR